MAENTENLTLKLLQEMRAEMREGFKKNDEHFIEIEEQFQAVNTRIDGNTMILNMLAGFIHQHEARLDTLEAKRP